MGWTWYLALDMQLYWISPVLLLALHKSHRLGLIVWTTAFLGSIITTFALAYQYHLSANALPGVPGAHLPGRPHQGNVFSLIANKPYTRMGPYLLGILLAYYLTSRYSVYSHKLQLRPLYYAFGWATSGLLAFLLVYCVTGFQARLLKHNNTQFEDALWLAVNRPLWGGILAWVTFTCLTGAGGWVTDILAAPLWLPISRLTFCAYLLHPIVLNTFYNTLKHPVYYQDGIAVFYFLGSAIVSYLAAAAVAVTVELPFAQMEEVFASRRWQS
jgi:peptidoglycan/LPS O-acetylase OafA/YrhL